MSNSTVRPNESGSFAKAEALMYPKGSRRFEILDNPTLQELYHKRAQLQKAKIVLDEKEAIVDQQVKCIQEQLKSFKHLISSRKDRAKSSFLGVGGLLELIKKRNEFETELKLLKRERKIYRVELKNNLYAAKIDELNQAILLERTENPAYDPNKALDADTRRQLAQEYALDVSLFKHGLNEVAKTLPLGLRFRFLLGQVGDYLSKTARDFEERTTAQQKTPSVFTQIFRKVGIMLGSNQKHSVSYFLLTGHYIKSGQLFNHQDHFLSLQSSLDLKPADIFKTMHKNLGKQADSIPLYIAKFIDKHNSANSSFLFLNDIQFYRNVFGGSIPKLKARLKNFVTQLNILSAQKEGKDVFIEDIKGDLAHITSGSNQKLLSSGQVPGDNEQPTRQTKVITIPNNAISDIFGKAAAL